MAGRGPQPAADWLPRLPDGEMEAAGGELVAGRLASGAGLGTSQTPRNPEHEGLGLLEQRSPGHKVPHPCALMT